MKFKKFSTTAIAVAMLGTSFAGISHAHLWDDSAEVQVKAEFHDYIGINTNDNSITLSSTDINSDNPRMTGVASFRVIRAGASESSRAPYSLKIEGAQMGQQPRYHRLSAKAPGRNLSHRSWVNVKIEAEDRAGNTGVIRHNQAFRGLETGWSRRGNETNLDLTFTIPTKDVESAVPGNYYGDFTVVVAAI